MQHLYFEFATVFVLYYSHDCHLSACLQSRQHPPQIGHILEQPRRCGVAAQRWRFTVRAVTGHGPTIHSTRLHANAAAADAAIGDDQVNGFNCDGNKVADNSTRTLFDEQMQRLQQEVPCCCS
jgi:hypothetical protein